MLWHVDRFDASTRAEFLRWVGKQTCLKELKTHSIRCNVINNDAGGGGGGEKNVEGESRKDVDWSLYGLVELEEETGELGKKNQKKKKKKSVVLPKKSLQDANALRALVSKAFKYVDLMKSKKQQQQENAPQQTQQRKGKQIVLGGGVDQQQHSDPELRRSLFELKLRRFYALAAKAEYEEIRQFKESCEEEKDLLLLLASSGGDGRFQPEPLSHVLKNEEKQFEGCLDALVEIRGQIGAFVETGYTKLISDPWKKLVDESLSVQIDILKSEQIIQGVVGEIERASVEIKAQQQAKVSMAGMGKDHEEFRARLLQLEGVRSKYSSALEKKVNTSFMPLVQNWTLLLQAYYQYLLDKVYKKNTDLIATLDSLPSSAPLTQPERKALESHWKAQFEQVSKFLSEWQSSFLKEGEKVQLTFQKAKEHLQSIKNAFKEWVRQDLRQWLRVLYLKKLAGFCETSDKVTTVKIVEIDSDHSEEEVGEEEENEGYSNGSQPDLLPQGFTESFAFWDKSLNEKQRELEKSEGELSRLEEVCNRLTLKKHQLLIASAVDGLYFGKLADLFFSFEAEKAMQSLLTVEEAKDKKKKRSKAKNATPRANVNKVNGKGEQAEEEQDEEEEDEEEVIIDSGFQGSFAGSTIFSVLQEEDKEFRPPSKQPTKHTETKRSSIKGEEKRREEKRRERNRDKNRAQREKRAEKRLERREREEGKRRERMEREETEEKIEYTPDNNVSSGDHEVAGKKDGASDMQLECEKIYLKAKENCALALQSAVEITDDMLLQRERVLTLAYRQSQCDLCKIKLDIARNIVENGDLEEWREEQTKLLLAAHEKVEKAELQLRNYKYITQV